MVIISITSMGKSDEIIHDDRNVENIKKFLQTELKLYVLNKDMILSSQNGDIFTTDIPNDVDVVSLSFPKTLDGILSAMRTVACRGNECSTPWSGSRRCWLLSQSLFSSLSRDDLVAIIQESEDNFSVFLWWNIVKVSYVILLILFLSITIYSI